MKYLMIKGFDYIVTILLIGLFHLLCCLIGYDIARNQSWSIIIGLINYKLIKILFTPNMIKNYSLHIFGLDCRDLKVM